MMHHFAGTLALPLLAALPHVANAIALPVDKPYEAPIAASGTCRKTKVAILGAGIAGITAAQALHNQSISDFLIVEYQDDIGGRVRKGEFGKNTDGKPITIELGANWVQGLGNPGGPENPIWTFAQKWNLTTTPSDFEKTKVYDQHGEADYIGLVEEFDAALGRMEAKGGEILANNYQDPTVRAGLRLVGWKPEQMAEPMAARAVEWWLWDGEQAYQPEECSLVYGAAVSNFTFKQFSDGNNFITDQRGNVAWLRGEASTFLAPNDPRLLLSTIVTNITYSPSGVTVTHADGSCIDADYAITTFSLGVLQRGAVSFSPALPPWKTTALEMFTMGIYTKIFLQFPSNFWGSGEFFLYADPHERGYFPIFQSLDDAGFFPGAHVLFVTVVTPQSKIVERQTDAETQAQVLAVLARMFPNATIPQPTAFFYPRWGQAPWAYGSWSNWPPGSTLEMHQNVRANVDRLWFAGEHTSASYFGYMQGAWFEGKDVGSRIAGLLGGVCTNEGPSTADGKGFGKACGEMTRYEELHGTTEWEEYDIENGWDASSFYDSETAAEGQEVEEE